MPVHGTLITYTTYGTWLRGDARGWVDDGIICPPDPMLELADFERLNHPAFRFQQDQLFDIGQRICDKLQERLQLRLLALTVQTWHVHFVAPSTTIPLSSIVKETKETVRFYLKPSQPLWTVDYDRRYCYDWERLRERVIYVEEHNVRQGWPRQPWQQLMDWDEYVRSMIG